MFVEDPFLVRGLDYYTETAFELESDLLDGAQNALAGGGRYDLLAREIGAKTAVPAVGFAAGMERLFLALHAASSALQSDAAPELYIVVLGEKAQEWASVTSRALRQAGVRVEVDISGRSAKAQMREANRLGALSVVVVGDDELQSGVARLRDMANAGETEVRLDAEALKSGVASSLPVVDPEATR
jgi:histidyl-tRNA synthetase